MPNAPLSWSPEPAPAENAAPTRVRAPARPRRDSSITHKKGGVAPRVRTEEEDRLLETMHDSDVAVMLGTTPDVVEWRRMQLDIRGFTRRVDRKASAKLAGARYIDDINAG